MPREVPILQIFLDEAYPRPSWDIAYRGLPYILGVSYPMDTLNTRDILDDELRDLSKNE